jgi:transposase-like protein
MGAARDRWAGLVRRWERSGQTARQFAQSAGVNAGTLAYWAWRLKRERTGTHGSKVKRRTRSARAFVQDTSFVELIVDRQDDGRFLLELGDGRRLRIPAAFDADGLKRLLTALRETP